MTTLPALNADEFQAFFNAVHSYDPFPWQARLVNHVVEHGWPRLLNLPTGTGKTAALDVAVFTLALSLGQSRRVPRRVVFVVDRRTIVDQAFERAETIRRVLASSTNPVVSRVRDRLLTLGGETPLTTALLRGGIARDDSWIQSPTQPMVLVSTVDQVGSRLLFRGYGVTEYARPIHAGLLGNDTLYLLDEVHLSQPFKETLQAVAGRYRDWAEQPISSPFAVVEMSATPGESVDLGFELDSTDHANSTLSTRLTASKKVSLASVASRAFVTDVSNRALELSQGSRATIAVIVNRVNTAREVHRTLRELAADKADTLLLTGRMRPIDRDEIESAARPRLVSGRERQASDRPLIVVSTQSIEAGADFDFDGMVSECASLDALRQRFGRLDRLGQLHDAAVGCIVAQTDTFDDDAVYGDAIGRTFQWLSERAIAGVIDFGLSAMNVPDNADVLGLLSPRAHAPVLLPSHLDAWVQTSPAPEPDPDISLWLHGPQRDVADVQIIWRADLTEGLLCLDGDDDAVANRDEVAVSIVDALPPVSAEMMSVPFLAAKRWLEMGTEPSVPDVEGAMISDDDKEPRKPPARASRHGLLWIGDESRVISARELRPGQTIVVPATYGGIEHGNWSPASLSPVSDRGEIATFRAGRRPIFRLIDAVSAPLVGLASPRPEGINEDEDADDRSYVAAWLATLPDPSSPELQQWIDRFRARLSVERRLAADGSEYFVVHSGRRPVERGSSFTGVDITLRAHSINVAALVSQLCIDAGLEDLRSDMMLAAEWHDAGKVDERFQRWLHAGSEFKVLVQPEPLAKSKTHLESPLAVTRARERSGYPKGGRHELSSLALMESAGATLATSATDWDLVRQIVASHHGRCRPFAPWAADAEGASYRLDFSTNGVDASATAGSCFEELDSGIGDRFWLTVRRYGWWGQAYLECLLRLADHRQSKREQNTGGQNA